MKTELDLRKFYNIEFGKNYKIIRAYCDDLSHLVGRTFHLERRKSESRHGYIVCISSSGIRWSLSTLDAYDYVEVEPFSLLTLEEKEYLSNVIKPFKDRVLNISKLSSFVGHGEAIDMRVVRANDSSDLPYEVIESIRLPYFKKGTMYKNLIEDKKYTLEELGL